MSPHTLLAGLFTALLTLAVGCEVDSLPGPDLQDDTAYVGDEPAVGEDTDLIADTGLVQDEETSTADTADDQPEEDEPQEPAEEPEDQDDTGVIGFGACGDGVVSSYEECDGAADQACPGRCSAHCACPSGPVGDLRVTMIDVGQGDALLIVSPDGFVTLVDAGKSGNWDDNLAPALAAAGVSGIDYTLVSHLHADHLGAMDEAIEHHPEVVASFDHGGEGTSGAASDYFEAASGRRTPLQAGATIDMGPSMLAEVLHPGAAQMDEDENDRSVVLRLVYGETRFLLGGDCETANCESGLKPGPIDVYKVHHHGSSTSSSEALLNEMMPGFALISVGEGNSYGHPTDATLDRLDAVGAQVWRTDQDGTVFVTSDGEALAIWSDPS